MSDGTTFTIDLPVTGQAGLDAAASSMDAIEKGYRKAESSFDSASRALERVGVAAELQRAKVARAMEAGDTDKLEAAKDKLQEITDQEGILAERAQRAKAALDQQAAALDAAKGSAGGTPAPEAGGEGLGLENFEGMERSLNRLGGPLGSAAAGVSRLFTGASQLTRKLGDAGPWAVAAIGIAAVAAAAVALGAKIISLTVDFAEWTIKLADSARTSRLLSDGIARSVAGGALLNDKIGSLTKTLPLTQDELQGMAQKLGDSGLRGKALTNALDQAAVKAAKLKFGPDFAKEMLSLDQQSKVFHANLAGIFGGLKTDGLMTALQKLIGLFDADSASGKAMKVVFESIFQPLIDKVAQAEPMIERFFLQLEVWALKGMIAIKPYGSTILKIGEGLAIVAGVVVGVFAVAIVQAIAFVAALGAAAYAVGASIMWAAGMFQKAGAAIAGFFQGLDVAGFAKAMIDGLVNGITGGATAVVNAMKGVVNGAVDAAKHALGIASPSKVFAQIGLHTSEGMSMGVDKGAGDVQSSLENMVSPPPGKPGAATAQAPAASSSNSGGNFSGAQFHFYGVKDAQDAIQRFEEMLTRTLEGDVTKLGGAQPA